MQGESVEFDVRMIRISQGARFGSPVSSGRCHSKREPRRLYPDQLGSDNLEMIKEFC